MALEVAHAYDENKNLVPLYIVTDSDPVYEPTTPGFDYSVYNPDNSTCTLIIISNSLNPTGGSLVSEETNVSFLNRLTSSDIKINISNQSGKNLYIVLSCRFFNGYNTTIQNPTSYSGDVQNNSNVEIKTLVGGAYAYFTAIYITSLSVQLKP